MPEAPLTAAAAFPAPPPVAPPVEAFRRALLARGLLIETGVDGLYGRGAAFERVVEGFDALVTRAPPVAGAEVLRFPPAMPRRGFEASGYFRNFPQLTGTVHCFCGSESDHRRMLECQDAGADWTGEQRAAGVVLTPASCYPAYPIVAARGPLPAEGHVVDAASYCFRHEPSLDPARMQLFRQREHVRFGTPGQVQDFQMAWLDWAVALFRGLGLPAEADTANDPFFGRAGKLMANGQRSQRLKFEVLIPVAHEDRLTACASANYHVDHFAGTWGIRLESGEIAHTGCAGFGLERVALALFRHHGLDAEAWPAPVRAALWPAA